ncbi:hypothetical protein MACJ_001688 [Theileria orientalis]|uniref:Uncharacterized protein n=1 Tax=Theileria orientalis TaxID=68886 RepID=A0A976QRQ7_THEOR|nr:hypothetical protein MACJ_001688 [Theileria orientalis]
MTSQLEDIEENSVENKLREENDNIYPYLPYLIDLKNDYSYKVNVEQKKDESNLGNFTKYSHTPQSGYSGKNSLVLYNGEKLMEKNNNKLEQIQEIQNVVYKAVNVYFGTKNQTIPLIIQLNKSEVSNNSKYYVHKKDDTSYWEKWEFQSTDDNKELLKKLKETESNLFDSISLLIDYDKAYTKDELEKIPGVKVSGSQPEKIDVSEYMNLECLNKSNYKCYKHCLTCKTNLDSSDIENVKLKLFIATETNRYSEISLHSSDDANDFNREHIYYEKGKTLNDFENNLYVIFYYEQNKKGDPRPVLFSYQKKVYRPLNLNEYSRKWVCVENSDFNPDICTDFNLLKILKGVSYFMNPVNIDEATGRKIGDYGITDRYITHRFNNSTTVQITIKPDDLNCYRKYTHSTTFGYILGEVNHNGSKLFESYEKYNSSLSTNRVGNFPSMIDYENKNDNLIIESADKCNERNNVGVIVGVLSIIGVVAGGVAGAVYKFPEFFRSIYRRIN